VLVNFIENRVAEKMVRLFYFGPAMPTYPANNPGGDQAMRKFPLHGLIDNPNIHYSANPSFNHLTIKTAVNNLQDLSERLIHNPRPDAIFLLRKGLPLWN